MRTVYKDERIEVATTGRNYDFIAMVENKTNDDIVVAPDIGGLFEEFTVPAKEWVGLLANDDGSASEAYRRIYHMKEVEN